MELYNESAVLLRVLVDLGQEEGSGISSKKKNMAAGELVECETKARVLQQQMESKSRSVITGGANVLASLTVAGAGKLTMGTGKLVVGGTVGVTRALRHNVLSDSLGGNTRRFLQASSLLAKIDEEKLKVMFEVLDEDDSGGLDKEELAQVFQQMGRTVEGAKLDKIFRGIDKDKNGSIEYDEFLAWWRKQRAKEREAIEEATDELEKTNELEATEAAASAAAAAAAAAAPKTDVAATKKKTRGALLGGLRNGKLEHAVAKMEADEVQFDNPVHVRDGAADNHGR